MADTLDIVVFKDDGWTEVITSGGGFFSASKSCQYCFAQSQPAESFYGHRLGTSELNIYWIPAFEKMYVKAGQDLVLVVSEELEVVQRILIRLNGVDEYFTLQNTKTLAGDFRVGAKCVLPTSSTIVTLFGQAASASNYFKVLSTGFASISIGGSVVTSTVLATKDRKLKVYEVELSGNDFLFLEDGVTIDTVTDAGAAANSFVIDVLCQSNGGDFFSGTYADPNLTDPTTPSNSESWQLNRALPATTEQSSSGANILTYIAAARDLFTFNQSVTPNRWVGITKAVNGGFDTDTDWSKTDGSTISGGVATISNVSGALIQQDMGLVEGDLFEVEWDITDAGASSPTGITFSVAGGFGPQPFNADVVGHNKVDATSTFDSPLFRVRATSINQSSSFDNVSIKIYIETA